MSESGILCVGFRRVGPCPGTATGWRCSGCPSGCCKHRSWTVFVSFALLPRASNMVTTHVPSIWTAPTRPISTSDSSRQSNLNPASRDGYLGKGGRCRWRRRTGAMLMDVKVLLAVLSNLSCRWWGNSGTFITLLSCIVWCRPPSSPVLPN